MEHLIALVIVLFTLSIIFERIIEFLKNYLSCRKIGNSYWVGDTTTKHPPGSPQELRRHYRILKLNLAIGFLTAVLCHANLFELLGAEDPGKQIGWDHHTAPIFSTTWWQGLQFGLGYLPQNLYFLLGCLLTGAFISLGSKFWHDLLDILILAKDARRTAISAANASLDFQSLPEDEQRLKMQAAIKMHGDDWTNTYPELTGIGISRKLFEKEGVSTPQAVIQFQVLEKKSNSALELSLPSFVEYYGYRIPTDVVSADHMELTAWMYSGVAHAPKRCGASISRTFPQYSSTGTIGLKVARDSGSGIKYYLLTCAHVVLDKEMSQGAIALKEGDTLPRPEVGSPGLLCKEGISRIGTVVEAKVSSVTDTALILLDDPDLIDGQLNGIGKPTGYYKVTTNDVNKLHVQFSGAASGHRKDILVRAVNLEKSAKYPPATGISRLQGLIAVDKSTQPGDSGASVVNGSGKLIGLIVGHDNRYTYIIPIQQIRAQHGNINCIDIP